MNKLKLIFVFIAMIGLASCSDEDGGNTNNGNAAGSWEPTELTYNGTSTFTQAGQTVSMDFSAVGIDFHNTVITLNNDGTFDSAGEGITVEMTMEFMGQEMTQEMSAPSFISEGTWEVNGSTMTLTESSTNEPQDYDIVELSDTTMRLTGTQSTEMNGSEATVNVDMTLTRI